jgi:predicted RNA polymerase sigma factor
LTQRKQVKQETKKAAKVEESEEEITDDEDEGNILRSIFAKITPYLNTFIKTAILLSVVGSIGYVEYYKQSPSSLEFNRILRFFA